MAQHRRFIDHDVALRRRVLHLLRQQKLGHRLGGEAVLAQHADRRRRRRQVGDVFSGQPHPFIELVQRRALADTGGGIDQLHPVVRAQQAGHRAPLLIVERTLFIQAAVEAGRPRRPPPPCLGHWRRSR